MSPILRALSMAASNVAPHFLMRVAGLPVTWLKSMVFAEITADVTAALDLEEHLLACREAVAAILFVAARNTNAAESLGHTSVIQLKRDLYNLRLPPSDLLGAVVSGLSEPQAAIITEFVEDLRRYAGLMTKVHARYTDDASRSRRALQRLLANPQLQSSVIAASPPLMRAIATYLRGDPAAPDKRMRQAEKTCAKLVLRTMVRTTPLSGLATVAFGFWAEAAPSPPPYQLRELRSRSRVRLNPVLTMAFARALERIEALWMHLHVFVNPTVRDDGLTLHWLHEEVTVGDGGWVRVNPREKVARARATPALREILALLKGIPPTLATLESTLNARASMGKSEGGAAVFLRRLDEVGLVHIRLLIPDLADDHLAVMIGSLPDGVDPVVDQARCSLNDIRHDLEHFESADAEGRASLRGAVERRLFEIAATLGVDLSKMGRLAFFEDVAFHVDPLYIGGILKPSPRLDLDILAALASLFDIGAAVRAAAIDYFLTTCGPTGQMSLIDLHVAMRRRTAHWATISANSPVDVGFPTVKSFALPGFQSQRLDRLAEAQRAVFEFLDKALRAQLGTEEVVVDPADLSKLVAPVNDLLAIRGAISVFLQAELSQVGRVVVNQVFPGVGKCMSRFVPVFDNNGEACSISADGAAIMSAVRDWHATLETGQHFFCDVDTGLGHAGSTRRSHGTFEISYPGAVARTAPDRQVDLGELVVSYDAAEDRLRLTTPRLDREIMPLELGFLHSSALPPLMQLVGQFAPIVTHPYLELLWDHLIEGGAGVRRTPRLVLGRLVLKRAAWWVVKDAMPRRTPRETAVDWALSVARWRREHNIPSQTILRQFTCQDVLRVVANLPGAQPQSQSASPQTETVRGRFPLLIDFDSPFGLALFEDAIEATLDKIVLEEVLPTFDQTPTLNIEGGPHVAEFVIEVANRPLS